MHQRIPRVDSPSRSIARRLDLAAVPVVESLEDRRLMTTAAPAYLVPTAAGVEFTPIITTGEAAGNGFRFAVKVSILGP